MKRNLSLALLAGVALLSAVSFAFAPRSGATVQRVAARSGYIVASS